MQSKSKTEWLRQLRRYSTPETVEWAMHRLYNPLSVEVWHSVK